MPVFVAQLVVVLIVENAGNVVLPLIEIVCCYNIQFKKFQLVHNITCHRELVYAKQRFLSDN